MPMIDPPGHAAYPSGHATQSRLVARCLEQVMPSAIIPIAAGVDAHRLRPSRSGARCA